MQFKLLRKYISQINRVSISVYETREYQNFRFIHEVPEKYDEFYVHGIGTIESEFKENKKSTFLPCIEIILTEKQRNDI